MTIWNGITAVGQWLVSLLTTAWGAILLVLDAAVALVVGAVGVVGVVIAQLFGLLLTVALSLIPNMPEADHSGTSGLSALAAANQYVPIAEALAFLPVVGAIAGGIGAYKLAKFIRGGG